MLKKMKIGDICQSLHQGLNTAGEKVVFVEKGFPVIQTRNITSNGIDVSNKLKSVTKIKLLSKLLIILFKSFKSANVA